MKSLPPQHLKPRYYEPIEAQLQSIFYDLLFKPLLEIAKDANAQMSTSAHGMMNAVANALQAALRNGRIQYEAGVFSGHLSADITRTLRAIGAKYDIRSKVYRLDPINVPGWVKAEAAHYQATAKGAHDAMVRRLDEIQQGLDATLDKRPISAKKTLRAIQTDFRDVAQQLQIHPELSGDSLSRLAADYNQSLQLPIRTFSKQMITDLRSVVEQNAQTGYRFDKLTAGLQSRYGVTQNKAKFLARQETGLFMSKYRRERFGEAGVTHYKWSTSHDERVRPTAKTHGIARADNHRRLDGRVFAYADPPIVDSATGRKANPGEDFNCRCVDIPVLERMTVAA